MREAAPMSSRGQSLSMYVVQRSFGRARNGYDPNEVDRHLELVSRWFTSTDVGVTITREKALLQEREDALRAREAEVERALEGARVEAEATLEGARVLAAADRRAGEQALADARGQAAEILDQAKADAAAAAVILAAREEASALLEAAR